MKTFKTSTLMYIFVGFSYVMYVLELMRPMDNITIKEVFVMLVLIIIFVGAMLMQKLEEIKG